MAYRTKIQMSFWAMIQILIMRIFAPAIAKRIAEKQEDVLRSFLLRSDYGSEIKLWHGREEEDYVLCVVVEINGRPAIVTDDSLDRDRKYRLTTGRLELNVTPEMPILQVAEQTT